MINSFTYLTYWMAPLHSLVGSLKTKNRFYKKEGVILRPQCLGSKQAEALFLSHCSLSQGLLRETRLMWTPPTSWNHPADASQQLKLQHVSNCKRGSMNMKSLKVEFRKVLIQAQESKILYLPMWCSRGETHGISSGGALY